MADETIPRRKFLLSPGLAGTAVAAGLAENAPPAAADPQSPAAAAQAPAQPEPLLYLNETEHAFVVAAADT